MDAAKISKSYKLERDDALAIVADTLTDLSAKYGWHGEVKAGLIRVAIRRDLIDMRRKANAHFRKRVKFVSSESIPEGHVHATIRHNGKAMPSLKAHDDDLVADLLGCLDEREFLVVSRCVIGCIPQTQVACELGLSRQYVAKIRDRALMTMRSRLEKL